MPSLDLAGELMNPPIRRVIVEELVKRRAVRPRELIHTLGSPRANIIFHINVLMERGFVKPIYKPTNGEVELFYVPTEDLKDALRAIGRWAGLMLKALEGGGA